MSRAIEDHAEVLVFPAAMKGTGEGSFDWDLKPGSTMTNADVETTVATFGPGRASSRRRPARVVRKRPPAAVMTTIVVIRGFANVTKSRNATAPEVGRDAS